MENLLNTNLGTNNIIKLTKEENTMKNTEIKGMDDLFEDLENTMKDGFDTEQTSEQDKKERAKVMKMEFEDALLADPEMSNKLRSLSDSVQVENSLGFGDKGNIIVDKTKEERTLIETSQIVGYRVKNIGSQPIKYQTEEWKLGEDGLYESTKVEKELAPGGVVDLTRKYMTIFCARPEISFTLANGKIIKGSGAKTAKTFDSELESYYFRFNKDENGVQKQINDDDVKLNVGKKVGDEWVVKSKFVSTFGYLNNPAPDNKGERRSSKEKYTRQDMEANLINKLIEEAGLLEF